MKRIIVVLFLLMTILTAPPQREYCVVTEVSCVDTYTDLVTVENDGMEYQFYSDAGDYMPTDYVEVGFDTFGRIVSAE